MTRPKVLPLTYSEEIDRLGEAYLAAARLVETARRNAHLHEVDRYGPACLACVRAWKAYQAALERNRNA